MLRWLPAAAAAAVPASLLLAPWHRSGKVTRSGLELARVADDLELVSGGARRALLVAVLLTPLLAVVTIVAIAAGRERVAAVTLAGAGAVGISCALMLHGVAAGTTGPRLAIVTGAAAAVAALRLATRGGPR
jgi:hypothetical protein